MQTKQPNAAAMAMIRDAANPTETRRRRDVPPSSRIVDSAHRQPDLDAAAQHFAAFMSALGFDPSSDDEHLRDTPQRVARMYAELLHHESFTFTTFPEEGSQMVTMTSIPFASFCAHHFLPFRGVAHIAYIPRDRIVGLSKLARAVEFCAAAPNVQERLTNQIALLLDHALDPLGVAVAIEARHDCMELRGVKAHGAVTHTTALLGCFRDDDAARQEFLSTIRHSKESH